MAAAASNEKKRKDLRYPELEEQALQFILDSCESSISKYSKFLQVTSCSFLSVKMYYMSFIALNIAFGDEKLKMNARSLDPN